MFILSGAVKNVTNGISDFYVGKLTSAHELWYESINYKLDLIHDNVHIKLGIANASGLQKSVQMDWACALFAQHSDKCLHAQGNGNVITKTTPTPIPTVVTVTTATTTPATTPWQTRTTEKKLEQKKLNIKTIGIIIGAILGAILLIIILYIMYICCKDGVDGRKKAKDGKYKNVKQHKSLEMTVDEGTQAFSVSNDTTINKNTIKNTNKNINKKTPIKKIKSDGGFSKLFKKHSDTSVIKDTIN